MDEAISPLVERLLFCCLRCRVCNRCFAAEHNINGNDFMTQYFVCAIVEFGASDQWGRNDELPKSRIVQVGGLSTKSVIADVPD